MADIKVAMRGAMETQVPADGLVATNAEAVAGVRNDRILTPASAKSIIASIPAATGSFTGAGCTMLFDGDSLTYGYLLPDPATQNYGAQFFGQQFCFGAKAYYNFAVSGDRMNQIAARYATFVRPHRPDSFGGDGGPRAYLFVTAGTNNFVDGISAADLLAQITAYIATARADGFTVVWGTITPSTYFGIGGWEEKRMQVNAAIRRNDVGANFVWDMESYLQNSRDTIIFPDGGHYSLAACTILAKNLNLGMMNGGFPISSSFGISKNGHSQDAAFECASPGDFEFTNQTSIIVKNLGQYKRLSITGTIYPSTQSFLRARVSTDNGATFLDSGYLSLSTVSANILANPIVVSNLSGAYWDFSGGSTVGNNALNEMHFALDANRFNEAQRTGMTIIAGLENTSAVGHFTGFLRHNTPVACNALQIYAETGNVTGSIMVEGSRS